MGRKTRITKEMIMEAAYELLDESGIGVVAIKNLAAKLDCSTQPISWQFGSMTELKKELYEYAGKRVFGQLFSDMEGRDALDAFFIPGVRYISTACDHPNVFRFVNVDSPIDTIGEQVGGDASIFSTQFDDDAVRLIADRYGLPEEKVGRAVQDTVIYTHGLAVMMMFDNYRMPRAAACRMIYDMGMRQLSDIGVDVSGKKFEDIYNSIFNKEIGNK